MKKKLTIMIDEQVYNGLYTSVGAHNISRFIEGLVRPFVIKSDLESAYREMGPNEALFWAEALIQDKGVESLWGSNL